MDSHYNSSAINSARQDGRAVEGARLKSCSKMRILVHDCVRGFESHSCHIFKQFPIKNKCLAFNWSAANSARQDSQSSQALQIQHTLKFQNFQDSIVYVGLNSTPVPVRFFTNLIKQKYCFPL